MAMSDCIKCWETPCICGYAYRLWPLEKKIELVEAILFGTHFGLYTPLVLADRIMTELVNKEKE
jgi:hypothetical protein